MKRQHLYASRLLVVVVVVNSSTSSLVNAQSLPENTADWNADPIYTAIILVIFIFLFVFSYIFFYNCFRNVLQSSWNGTGHQAHRVHYQLPSGGLDPSFMKALPVFKYSEVSGLRPDNSPLECAVCLSLFEAQETLRLLPKCEHVFHVECVDPWLVDHGTCPLCRANVKPDPNESKQADLARVIELGRTQNDVNRAGNNVVDSVIDVRRENHIEGQFGKHWRFNSTGHVAIADGLEDRERYTLRLPDDVRNDIMRGTLNRCRSCNITIEVD